MADSIPDGWRAEKEIGKHGTEIECYTNDIGQRFYSMEDLMRYVNYAQRAKLSIYAPDCNSPTVGGSRSKKNKQSTPGKPRKQAEKAAGKQRSKGLMHVSNQSGDQSDNPEAVSLPSELSKKSRGGKNLVSASATDAQPPHA